MSINNILTQLREEHRLVEQAILSLEELARDRGREPGRPPARLVQQKNIGYCEKVVSSAAAD